MATNSLRTWAVPALLRGARTPILAPCGGAGGGHSVARLLCGLSLVGSGGCGQGAAVLGLCKEKGPLSLPARLPQGSQQLLPPLPRASPAWAAQAGAGAAPRCWALRWSLVYILHCLCWQREMEGMSREMLWERKKETGLTWAWMVFSGNQQTIPGAWGILARPPFLVCEQAQGGVARMDQFFSIFCTWGMPPAAFQSFISLFREELNLQPHCPSFTEHSISLMSFAGKGLKS